MTTMTTDAPARTDTQSIDANREVATEFLTQAAVGNAREMMRKHAHPEFVHHNPWFAADAESLAAAMDDNARDNPAKQLEVLRTIAEGPLVALHARVQHKPGAPWFALVHLFRFEDGRIREMWDVGQEVPADSPNQHGMF